MRTALLLCASLFCASMLRADRVYLRSGSESGKVVVDNIEKVVIANGRTRAEFPQGQVLRIEYDGTPAQFHRAEALRRSGQFEEAALAYQDVLDMEHPELLRQYVLYGLGTSLLRSGGHAEAVPVLQRLLRESSDTRFLVEATETLVNLLLRQNRVEEIDGYLGPLRKHAPALAVLIEAKVAEAQGKSSVATELYAKAAEQLNDEDPAYWQARLGLARIALNTQNKQAFWECFKHASEDADLAPSAVMAEFCMLAARLEKEASRSHPDAATRALDYYTRVFALYGTPETDELSAEALYEAALMAEFLGGRSGLPYLRKEARQLLRLLIKRYPDSRWTAEAETRLKG